MKLRIKQCKVFDNKPAVAFELFLADVDKAKQYEAKDLKGYTIEIVKPRRSLDANKYMWHLLGELEDKTGVLQSDIYKTAIHEAGVHYTFKVANEQLEDFTKTWEKNGIGWECKPELPSFSLADGYFSYVIAYVGSSVYNSKQMSRLIDYIVEEAKLWGIETATPDEQAKMMQLWGV